MEQKVEWQDFYLQIRSDFAQRCAKLEACLEEVRNQNIALRKDNAALRKDNAALRKDNVALKTEVQSLKEKLNTNSSNSSKPPSQDPHRDKKQKKKRGRRRGGQPGHAGKNRTPYPPEKVTQTIQHAPPHCPHCGNNDLKIFKVVESFQTVEIPKPLPIVTQHERVRCHCQECGRASNGQFPAGLSKKLLGPRAMALFAILIAKLHSGRRDAKDLMEEYFGIKFSLGLTSSITNVVGASLEEGWKAARDAIHVSPIVHGDETSWFENHKLKWLWHASAPEAALFQILGSRSGKSAQEVLGDQAGRLLISDRFSAYTWFVQRQYCWAHLKRDFAKMAERCGNGKMIGRLLGGLTKQVFVLWNKYLKGQWNLKKCKRRMSPLRKAVRESLELGMEIGDPKTAATCKHLLKGEAHLWSFLEKEGIEPTNNEAERGLRPAVIWRKISLGTHSEGGMRFVERILTIMATLKKQKRGLWTYLEQAVSCELQGQTAPALFLTPHGG